jgi:transposase
MAGSPNPAIPCYAPCSIRAAQSLLTRSGKRSWLKAWGMRVAQRRGMPRAIVAVARRLAVVLHRMWVDGTEFRWSNSTTAVVPQAA